MWMTYPIQARTIFSGQHQNGESPPNYCRRADKHVDPANALNAAGRSLRVAEVDRVVGKSMSRFLQFVGLTRGVSIWLLARTASRTWARCCNAREVRNSESLRGLDAVLLERRGR